MDAQYAIDMAREALISGLVSIGPILLAGLVVAAGISFVQSTFQIQEQSLSTIPKLLIMFTLVILALPWLSQRFVETSKSYLETPWLVTQPIYSDLERE
ncbi:MAG: flagellar biosynthetic protein FliQ [Pirellulaceae bacterium]